MKKIILFAGLGIICLFLSFSPGKTALRTAEIGNSDSTNKVAMNRARNLAVYKGIETGDLSVMDKFVADDIVDHADMDDVKGRENVKKMLADIHNHFTNLKLTLISDATSEDGMYHFALVRMTGTTKDAMMGMAANTPVDRMSVDMVRIKDGKVVEHWGFDDPKEMMKMMNMKKQ